MVSSASRMLRMVAVILLVVLGVMITSCHAQGETAAAGEQAAGEQGEQAAGEQAAGEQAAGEAPKAPPAATRLSQCTKVAQPSRRFRWFPFADPGKWYVSHVSSPAGRLATVGGFAIYLKQENIREWRTAPLEVEEIFAMGHRCRRQVWDCLLKGQTTSAASCSLTGGYKNVGQSWTILASDYTSTAAVYVEKAFRGRTHKRIYLLVRRLGGRPNPGVMAQAMNAFCGVHAANPNSQFYTPIATGAGIPCIMAS